MEILQLLWSRRYCPANITQLNYSVIFAQPPLQNSTLNWLDRSRCLQFNPSARTSQKTQFLRCLFSCYHGNMLFQSRYSATILVYLLITNLLPSNRRRFVTVTQHGVYTLRYTWFLITFWVLTELLCAGGSSGEQNILTTYFMDSYVICS
jgi:hypothetical protein